MPGTYHGPVADRDVEPQSYAKVGGKKDWRAWIAANYPDDSKSWPADCAASFGDAVKGASWDFVAKGDFNKLGAPTALAIRFLSAPGAAKNMVARLSILECKGGSWAEILGLDADRGISADGEALSALAIAGTRAYHVRLATGVKAAPGLQLSVTPVDSDGSGLAEGAEFIYLPKQGRYRVFAH